MSETNIFERASREKLHFETSKGFLAVSDLWDLPLTELNRVAVGLNREIKASDEENFLDDTPKGDTTLKLSFDVVLHVLNTKKDERAKAKDAKERADKKQQLLGILARKKEDQLSDLSIEDLTKKINEL